MTLSEINQLYEEILHADLPSDKKDQKYAQLMTYMENYYKIPVLRSEQYEHNHKAIMAMYRKISNSRLL